MAWTDPAKRAANNARYRKQYYRRKFWIDKIKTKCGCAECGYNAHPAALDFDHIDPNDKEFLIPRVLSRGNLRRIFKEIRKCRILCANCHRIHSNKQWHTGLTPPQKEEQCSSPI